MQQTTHGKAWKRQAAALRNALLASSALIAGVLPAMAQDATWLAAPGSGDFNTGANWSTGTVPTGTASFGASSTTSLTFSGFAVVGGFTFNAGAPNYQFSRMGGIGFNGTDFVQVGTLEFNGAGIVNGAGVTLNNNIFAGLLVFSSGSTADSATINNTGNDADLVFRHTSTAGRATINSSQFLASFRFADAATAGNATITNHSQDFSFRNTSTAGNATIVNFGFGLDDLFPGDGLAFRDNSTAGNAVITNYGELIFRDTSSAGSATITNNDDLIFADRSTAGNATITNNSFMLFQIASTAGSATITNNDRLFFRNISTGGTARLINGSTGTIDLSGLTTAGMTAGSIEGAGRLILGAKNLTVGGNDLSTTFSGVISGAGGSLTKTGAGTLTFAGNNTYTGATTVNAGALIVNGDNSLSSLTTVNAGGMLGGTGTVGNANINGGTLSPGTSIGTITIKGSLVMSSAAAYIVEVSPTQADRTNVTGAATLAGSMALQIAAGSYTVNQQYVLLHADGGRTGTFTTTDIKSLFGPAVRARIDYTANDVILNLAPNSISPFLPPGAPQNVQNVAAVVDQIFQSGNAPPGFLGLFNLSPQGLVNALSQLEGQHAAGNQQASQMSMGMFLSMMLNPFADGRNGGFGAAMGYVPEQSHPAEQAFAAALPVKAPPLAQTFEQRWSVWGAAFGGKNRTGGDPLVVGSNDLTASAGGFAAGADYRISRETVVGAAVAIGETHWTVSGLGKGRSDAAQVGGYATTRWSNFYLAGAVAGAWYRAATDRTLTIAGTDRLEADFNAHSIGARIESGWRFGQASYGLTPYGAVQVQSLHTPAYSESATAGSNQFALAYAAQTATDTRSELGVWADTRTLFADGKQLTLRARAAWVHDFNPDSRIQAAFQTLPGASFTADGAAAPRNAALLSTVGEMRFRNGVTLISKIDGEFSSRSHTVAGTGTVRYAW